MPKFEDTAPLQTVLADELGWIHTEFEVPVEFTHKMSGACLVLVLIAKLAGAAIYHHMARKDIVLTRMLPILGCPE